MTRGGLLVAALVGLGSLVGRGLAQATTPTEQPPVVVEVANGGFDWLDAGIGAAVALAVVLLATGLVLALRQDGGSRGVT